MRRRSPTPCSVVGHRVRAAALGFASWAPSTGVLLLLATMLAIVSRIRRRGRRSRILGEAVLLGFGAAGFRMSLLHWVNDALLMVFFLVVGLEIKREFTVGHLATRRSAALPIAAAVGGMVVPALIYVSLVPARAPGAPAGACRWRPIRRSRWP